MKQKSALFKYLVAPLTIGVFLLTFFTVADAIRWEFTQKPRMLDHTTLAEITLDRCSHSSGAGKRMPVYTQYVEYTYQVAGKALKSNRISFYPLSGCQSFTKTTIVYYDPLDPTYALLKINREESGWRSILTQIPFQLCIAICSGALILIWVVQHWTGKS